MQIMDSSHNIGGSGPIDPYDKYRIEPVGERESREQTPTSPDPGKPPKEKLKFAARVLQILQKAVNYFIEKNQESAATEGVLADLLALRPSFEILKREDRSQDVKFLNNLSRTCLLYTSPSPRDRTRSRMPSSA